MYLERIEIQGFKSFAKKTVLQFAHQSSDQVKSVSGPEHNKDVGLTVIVGPNGSGKSNIADAVRWALGEQSVKTLRGKKFDDVIFSGSHKKSSLSFAEVSLYLNNADRKTPVDYAELVVTRRQYRDGEGEYLINGSKARLADVQLLLAKARFGQRAYAVVGQGLVDNFLNTSPAERKEFFDEATGVKMYQIKKHDAGNKLNNASVNLEQAEQLLAEIEPRMKSLIRQIKKLEQRAILEKELREWQKNYYAGAWHALDGSLSAVNRRVVNCETEQRTIGRELQKLNQEIVARERESYDTAEKEKLEKEQIDLGRSRDKIGQELAEIRARKNIAFELAGAGDIAWLRGKKEELTRDIIKSKEDLSRAEARGLEANKQVVSLRKEQNAVAERIIEFRRDIISYHSGGAQNSSAVVKKIRELLNDITALHDEIDSSFTNGRGVVFIKKQFLSLRGKMTDLKKIVHEEPVRNDADLEKINSEIITWEEKKNELTERYISAQATVAATQDAIAQLKELLAKQTAEKKSVSEKLDRQKDRTQETDKDLVKRERELTKEMAALETALAQTAQQSRALYEKEKKRRDGIIALQKKTQFLQSEYNRVSVALSAAQVEKARTETKLEDLENEIRRETGSLRPAIDCKDFKKIDEKEAQSAMQKLKHQLELIGGIDPEIQKEHDETKERYDFLNKQVTDLRAAITALQKIIASLENTIAEKFDKAFGEIAKQFEWYFKILFDGGSVRLEKIMEAEREIASGAESGEVGYLETEENKKIRLRQDFGGQARKHLPAMLAQARQAGENKTAIELRKVKKIFTGIEVMACPPHKKIKYISALSGGERALTSIALIAAIIAVNPSPFVMLDEVDAALDEANSARLAKILEDLAKKTQFIAITHNRTIMYKADIIYGVTMGDDGVSKLLSVKVEDVNGARR